MTEHLEHGRAVGAGLEANTRGGKRAAELDIDDASAHGDDLSGLPGWFDGVVHAAKACYLKMR